MTAVGRNGPDLVVAGEVDRPVTLSGCLPRPTLVRRLPSGVSLSPPALSAFPLFGLQRKKEGWTGRSWGHPLIHTRNALLWMWAIWTEAGIQKIQLWLAGNQA